MMILNTFSLLITEMRNSMFRVNDHTHIDSSPLAGEMQTKLFSAPTPLPTGAGLSSFPLPWRERVALSLSKGRVRGPTDRRGGLRHNGPHTSGGRDAGRTPVHGFHLPAFRPSLSPFPVYGLVMLAGLVIFLSACSSSRSGRPFGPVQQRMLDSSLKVSAAAIETGQPVAAGRLYEQLSQTFPSAPEPKLGLAYMALHSGDFTTADTLFTQAGSLAETKAIKAEALLGAGRASLGREDFAQAKTHFLAAEALAQNTPLASWVANGLAVVASLESDYPLAQSRFDEALQLSQSRHPAITANLVRMLIESGRMDEARQLYAGKSASYWLGGDGPALAQLIAGNEG